MFVGSHEKFRELCALSTSDHLTEVERKKLSEHLAICSSCRIAKNQFESLVDGFIPAIAAAENQDEMDQHSSWSIKAAEREFLKRLDVEPDRDVGPQSRMIIARRDRDASQHERRCVWGFSAAGILLAISLGLTASRFGRLGIPSKPATPTAVPNRGTAQRAEQQLPDLLNQLEMDRFQLAERKKLIAELKSKIKRQSEELAQLNKHIQVQPTENDAISQLASDAAARQGELQQQLRAVQSEVQTLQATLDSVEEESSRNAIQSAGLQAKVEDLTSQLEKRQVLVAEQQELLNHDRDIRELMGARDLYISELYDVAGSGETRKAFGRVFYTKEKSLIFYAYDLDQEARATNASTFQAWGQKLTGSDAHVARNLGIFYEDNKSKKRWVLKCNDPKTLAQIDTVFVTMEPSGGSKKPSGRPVLFAYLNLGPNHP